MECVECVEREREGKVAHIASECKRLVQKECNNWQHGRVALKWYEHKSEKVKEADKVNILWNSKTQIDQFFENCGRDTMVMKKFCIIAFYLLMF